MRIGASSERRSVLASRAGVDRDDPADAGRRPQAAQRSSRQFADGQSRRAADLSFGCRNPERGDRGTCDIGTALERGLVCAAGRGRFRLLVLDGRAGSWPACWFPLQSIGWWSFRFFLAQLRQHAGVGPTIVEISNHPLYPGEQYRMFVSQMGRLKLKRLTVQLTCEEETFYRQGTDVRVERYEAFTQVLCKHRDVLVDPQAPWEQQLAARSSRERHAFVRGNPQRHPLEDRGPWRIPTVAIVLPKFSRRRPSTGLAAETQPAVNISLCREDGVYEAGGTLTAKWRISRVPLDRGPRARGFGDVAHRRQRGRGPSRPSLSPRGREPDSSGRAWPMSSRSSVGCPLTPLSYHGRLISVRWCIRLRLFLADGREIVAEQPFHLVSPGSLPIGGDARILR